MSLRRLPTLIAFALTLLPLLVQPVVADERLSIAGTTVSLVPPVGFEPSTQFSGIENRVTGASLVVAEFPPEAHAQLSPLFGDLEQAKASFAKRQITVEKRLEVDAPKGKVPLLIGRQKAGGAVYEKWVTLFQGPKTVMITVQSPEGRGLTDDEVTGLIKTVSLGPPASIGERIGLLPFRIAAAPPFRFADVLINNTVLLVEGPKDVDPSGNMPIIIVSPQLAGGSIADRLDAGAEALLRGTRDMADATIDARKPVTFAGAEGVRLEGAFEEKGLKKRFVQYLSVPAGGKFIRLLATANADAFDRLEPAMDKVAASVAMKP